MKKLSPISLGVAICLASVALQTPSFAQVAPPLQPQPVYRYIYGDSGPMTAERAFKMLGPGCGNTTEAEAIALAAAQENERRFYTIPLQHCTPTFVLAEMDKALVPEDGPIAARPGDTLHCPFTIAGVSAIISSHYNLLLITCSREGYGNAMQLIRALDTPVRHIVIPSSLPPIINVIDAVDASGNTDAASDTTELNEPARFYRLSLTYAAPDVVLDELDQAYVPDSGTLILKPGEFARNTFKMPGVRLIFPDRHDHSLLVYVTPAGYKAMKALMSQLDRPFFNLSSVVSSSSLGHPNQQETTKLRNSPKRLLSVKP